MSKIVIRMSAGLANRMFQYTYGVYLSQRGYDVYYDNNYIASKWKFEDISWGKIFPNAKLKEASPKLIATLGGRYNFADKIRRHIFKGTSRVCITDSPFQLVEEERLNVDQYLIGVFQNAVPAQIVYKEITQHLTFPSIEGEKNNMLFDKIQNENSIAIHIRKGQDYLTRECFKGICLADYYMRAYNYIKNHVENPRFYLFTDNIQWAKENIKEIPYTVVDWNPTTGWGNHFDMQLMSACKHNIIANSTYSWWGAFLNDNPDKIVIGPNQWFYDKYYGDESNALLESWIAL